MPLREFACTSCNHFTEIYDPAIEPEAVVKPECQYCHTTMSMLWSVPHLDTADTFKAVDGLRNYRGPDGRRWDISNLHKLRQVEKYYQATGHNVRFDAYSGNSSNPDPVDGFGPEYWDGSDKFTNNKATLLPTMEK
jgi:hypothetical protein